MSEDGTSNGSGGLGLSGFDFPGFDSVELPARFVSAGRQPIDLPDFDRTDRARIDAGDFDGIDSVFQSVSNEVTELANGTVRSTYRLENSDGFDLEIVSRGLDGARSVIKGGTDDGFRIEGDSARFVNDGLADIAVPVAVRFTGERIKILNDGTISGKKTALLIDGAASIVNAGLIDGDVRLKGGAGSYDGRDGKLVGALLGSGLDDVARGGDAADIFRGRGGDDRLSGGKGADILRGNGGDDALSGGRGADLIAGGRGDDVLRGGTGRDSFVFGTSGGDDVVRDFRDGADRLDLRAFGFDSASEVRALATERDAGLLVDLADAGGGTILLEGLSRADFGAADFLI